MFLQHIIIIICRYTQLRGFAILYYVHNRTRNPIWCNCWNIINTRTMIKMFLFRFASEPQQVWTAYSKNIYRYVLWWYRLLIVSIRSTSFLNRISRDYFFVFSKWITHSGMYMKYERIFYTRKYRLSGCVPEDEYIFNDGGEGFILYSLQRLAQANKK